MPQQHIPQQHKLKPVLDAGISVTRLAWQDNLAQHAADVIVEKIAGPNLCQVTLLLSEPRAESDCRYALTRAAMRMGIPALIGPEVYTLRNLAENYPLDGLKTISDSALQLLLMDALKGHDYLYGHATPLSLARDLLNLFEQLTLHQVVLQQTESGLKQQIQQAYGQSEVESEFSDRESRLIHQIWQALKIQLSEQQQIDPFNAYALRLEKLARDYQNREIYYLGMGPANALEIHCLNLLAKHNRVHVFAHGEEQESFYLENHQPNASPTRPFSFVDHLLYSAEHSLLQRKQRCLERYPHSRLEQHLHIYACANLENEAQAIELQLREWLQQEKKRIAFVCNDRKLARRVRARLERYHIPIKDRSGWSLSTSSSATILELWLQCMETDFHYLALLDLLKSPYVVSGFARQLDKIDDKQWMTAVYALEKNIIHISQVASGLARYQSQCQQVLRKLPSSMQAPYQIILQLLQGLEQASAPLQSMLEDRHSAEEILISLIQSLQRLGIAGKLAQDPVGELVIQLLQTLRQDAKDSETALCWSEFRNWLVINMEQQRFNPPLQASRIQLLTLEQSDLQEFDAIVIGAAQYEHLPGHTSASVFFNNTACRNLGLPDSFSKANTSFHYFRRLLAFTEREDARPLLISYRKFQNQEPIQICPWVEALQTAHKNFYQQDLSATYIHAWMEQLSQTQNAPATHTDLSQASITPALLPQSMSASAYQQLVDCPYQYYAARALRLQPPDQIKQYMEKSDFGDLVHRSLYLFHFGPQRLNQRIDDNNYDETVALLKNISRRIFKPAVNQNFLHHAWWKKWEDCIAPYIDWLREQQPRWTPSQGETEFEIQMLPAMQLKAKIDRIDQGAGVRILDYKTGVFAKPEDMLSGESVQLLFYALLYAKNYPSDTWPVSELSFLKLDAKDFRYESVDPDAIQQLCEAHWQRINQLVNDMQHGQTLSAWGEASVCAYCSYAGLCRREYTMAGCKAG